MLDAVRVAQVQFSVALLVLIVLLTALAWRNAFGRPLASDVVVPRWLRMPSLSDAWRRRARWLLDGGLVAAAAIVALLSITAARPSGAGLDRSVVLNELIQAKYHGELGWDGLYACAWAADRDGAKALKKIKQVRVLELGPPPQLEPTPKPERNQMGHLVRKSPQPPPEDIGGQLRPPKAAASMVNCRERFDDARWAALGADVAALVAMNPKARLTKELQGHGPTATPTRLARQRLLFSVLPISGANLFVLSLLAGLLAVGALVLVGRAYGLRIAALVGIAVFVEFGASPIAGGATPTGVSIVAVVLAGFAAIELERWGLAGALLGFAAVELVWPTLLVLALLAKLAVDWAGGRPRGRELGRFAIGTITSAIAFVLLSASLPGGFGNWASWADQVALVRYLDSSRQVGLSWLFAPEGNLITMPRSVPYPAKAQHLVDRQGWILLCAVLLLAPSLLAARRLPSVAFAIIVGVTATFVLTSTEARTWGVALPLLVLAAAAIGKHHPPSSVLIGRPPTVLAAGGLALCVGMHGIARIHQHEPFLFNNVYSHLLTTLLLGLGVALVLLPDLREHGDPPGAPAAIPGLDPATRDAPKFPLIANLLRVLRSRRGKGVKP
jgi:hypothetical protein